MQSWLELEDGTRIPITDGFSIGRGAGNQLPLQDERASRRHALIHDRSTQGFWIVDLGSRNGTYRNNRRVQQPARLHDGDSIRVGASQFTFRQPAAAAHLTAPGATQLMTTVEFRSEDCWLLIGDLEGSTQLAHSSDPGALATLTAEWLRQCRKLIESSGGIINKFLGDGFFAFWRAAEDHTQHVVDCLNSLRQMERGGEPRFRVVLHRGCVHFGGGASLGEDNLSGPEVNFAFRMEKLAGSLGERFLISEAAANACRDFRQMEKAGQHTLPGFEGPFRFFRF